jgi:hypothetical protein
MTDFDGSKPYGNPRSWNYFFDMIDDSNSAVGKFSINAIGRRIKSVKDDNITIIYPNVAEPDYKDSSNRNVKVILYEDLETEPLPPIYVLSVTASTSVSAILSSPADIKPGDKVIITRTPGTVINDLESGLIGTFTIAAVQSASTMFTFSTAQSVTNGKYFLNFSRLTYATTTSNRSSIDVVNGSESFIKYMSISGPAGIADGTQNSSVSTSDPNYTRIQLTKNTTANIPAGSTLNFSAASATLMKYSDFEAINADALRIEEEFETLEIPYVSILKSQIENYLNNEDFQYKSDAFSTMRSLVYTHTNFNQGVSVNSIPLYFLEPNKRIHLSDINTEIFGDHYLQSFSIPLSNEGTMQMSAIKIQQ